MKTFLNFLYNSFKWFVLLVFISVGTVKAQKHTNTKYKANWESLAKHKKIPEWFKDAKLGIYFHWGVYSVPAYLGEWYPHWMYLHKEEGWGSGTKEYHEKTYGSDFDYHEFIPDFTGENFDAKEWAQLFKSAGAKFAGPVAQHHDGFAMWDSKINPWNAKVMGPKKDIVGEMLQALNKEGMKTITTFHMSNTMQSEGKTSYFNISSEYATGSNDPKLKKFYGNLPIDEGRKYWLNLTKEVVEKYSPDLIWFDSGLRNISTPYKQKMAAHFFNSSINKKNEVGLVTKEYSGISHDDISILDIERGGMKEMPEDFWMTDITISKLGFGWGYIKGQQYKSTELIVRNMIDAWSKKGVVLLNVSPDKHGKINKEQRSILNEIGEWIRLHKEAVYNTRAHNIYGYGIAEIEDGSHGGQSASIEYSSKDVRFTTSKNGKIVYVFLLGKPIGNQKIILKHILPKADSKIRKVKLVSSGHKVKWNYNSVKASLEIITPEEEYLNNISTVFKVELK